MSDDFDIGPLAWVKDEIEKSLNTGLENLHQWRENLTDTSPLKFAKTHIYQASGAFDMVGLEGCKLFCTELEKVFSKLEKSEVNTSEQLASLLIDALDALKQYLDGLMKGGKDVPLKLYDVLAPVLAIEGRELDKSAFFFPDLSRVAPKDLLVQELAEEDYSRFIQQQRQLYQKSFLAWLQTKQHDALKSMGLAMRNVSSVQTRTAPRTLWWSASVFAEALQGMAEHDMAAAKRVCRKLDQELKLVQDGVAKPNSALLKDVLYYVAISESDSEAVDKVKQVFDLARLVASADDRPMQGVIDKQELGVAQSLIAVFVTISDTWNEISNLIDFGQQVGSQGTAVTVDTVLMTKCVDTLAEHQSLLDQLSQVVVVDLYKAIAQAIEYLLNHQGTATHPALIEIAAGMHLQLNALENYSALDANRIQKLLSEIERLERIAAGEHYDQLAPERSNELDADTIKAVVTHLLESLKAVEQSLDAFFRSSADKSPLSLVHKPLKSVAAVFEMLNMDVPASIAKLSQQYIEYFQSEEFQTNQGEFELLAESLSMLGIYAEGMPKVRMEYEQAMRSALERMELAFANSGAVLNAAKQAQQVSEQEAQLSAVSISNDDKKVTDQAFDDELLAIYLTEAEEVLAHIAQHLQVLKVAASHESLVEIRRGFHTLKGSGRTVGLVHLGEIAGKVELFLNHLLEKNITLTAHQINEVEQVAIAFAGWIAELQLHKQLMLNPEAWLARIEAWSLVVEAVDTNKKPTDEFVLIGGVRKLGRQFYTIFLNESMLNITTLEQDLAKMSETPKLSPSTKAKHATHTLASNALAAGFNHMGELGRAVEVWLDEVGDAWTPAQHKIYTRFVKSIARMWQAVSELKEPKDEKALLKAIQKATPSLNPALKKAKPAGLESSALDAVVEKLGEATEGIVQASTSAESDVITDESALSGEENTEVDAEILTLFYEEVEELLPVIGAELRAWRADPKALEHPDALQRALHTLKGSARMAGKQRLGDLVHNMEERVVQALKRKLEAQIFEHLFDHLDAIGAYFDEGHLPEVVLEASTAEESNDNIEAIDAEDNLTAPTDEKLNAQTARKTVDTDEAKPQLRATDRKTQYLRMRADTLDRLINEAGEISIIRSRIDKEVLGFKATSNDLTESVHRLRSYLRELEIEADTQLQSRLTLLQEANEKFDPLEFDRFTRLQELTRMMAESVNDITTIQNGLTANLGQAEAALQQQTRMNRDLQQTLMGVRMLPFSQISERMDRIVRQTARELNKRVEFTISGEKTEIDRSVLDKIGAPIEHLLRNAVAHGIERPSARKKQNKPESGKLHLKVSAQNEEIRIEIQDDGAGVDLAKVKEVATQRQLIAPGAEINDQQLMSVIFEPGFSTSSEVTQIAGRGVGLDVVRNEVSGLGGRIDVDSQSKQGTRFSIYLPVTLSVAQVLMVQNAQQPFAISVAMIEQAQKIKREDLAQAYQAGEIVWAGQHYPIHHLAKLLNQPTPEQHSSYASILLLRSGNYRIALHVDEVIGNQEVVIKPIGMELARVPGIMGATVTGEGRVIYIINPILLANREALSVGTVKIHVHETPSTVQKRKVLIVDDSLTMRKVLGRLFEREGYEIHVAKDGMDAMQILQQLTPDAILTDIEMPRMDGFGLARNIRDDARTAQTPLIMISSRTADKHQTLAKEIGVDAFFGKPVHDEELLAKVSELITQRLHSHQTSY